MATLDDSCRPSSALDLLFPPRCFGCGAPVTAQSPLCRRCAKAFVPLDEALGARFDFSLPGCDGVLPVYYYENQVRKALTAFKFRRDFTAGLFFAEQMAALYLRRASGVWCDSVAFIPMRPEGKRQRGYNQAELLAETVAERCGLSLLPEGLERFGSLSQHTLSGRFRHLNADRNYRLLPEANFEGRSILLVDDIITTGSTSSLCARLLKQAGAVRVVALAAAITPENAPEGRFLSADKGGKKTEFGYNFF